MGMPRHPHGIEYCSSRPDFRLCHRSSTRAGPESIRVGRIERPSVRHALFVMLIRITRTVLRVADVHMGSPRAYLWRTVVAEATSVG